MDNITHSLVGALIGQAGLKRKTGLAMPALIIGANLPDVDAACLFWLDGVEHLAFRRGITHGPIAWLLLPLLLAGILWGFDRWQAKRGTRPVDRAPVNFKWLFLLAFIACLTHPALDWLNVYGVRLLEPFSSRWFYGDTLFIVDVWLWALMGFACVFSLRRERKGGNWTRPAHVVIAVALAYIGLNATLTWNAENYYSYAPTGADVVIASPLPIISVGRELITGSNGLYAIGGNRLPGIPLDLCDLESARDINPDLDAFLFWSRAPFAERAPDGSVILRDARFYNSLIRDRFSVALPQVKCVPLAGE